MGKSSRVRAVVFDEVDGKMVRSDDVPSRKHHSVDLGMYSLWKGKQYQV